MGFIKNMLKGNVGLAESAVKTALTVGDELFETAEEKTKAKEKAHELFIKQLEVQTNSQSSSSVIRRVLSFMLVGVQCFYGLAAGVIIAVKMSYVGLKDIDVTDSIAMQTVQWKINQFNIGVDSYVNLMVENGTAVMVVLVFYFGRQGLESWSNRSK